jgi:hypothetical protein
MEDCVTRPIQNIKRWYRRFWRALKRFPTKRTITLISLLLAIMQALDIALKVGRTL